MAETVAPPIAERVTIQDAGRRHLAHLEAMGRKPSTLRSYRSQFDGQIARRRGAQPVGELTREDLEAFAAELARDGLTAKTVRTVLSC